MTMMTLNTSIPKGSSRRCPTGNLRFRALNLHETNLFVVQTISVQRRSRPESTSEAMREREEEKKTAPIFAARRSTFEMTLICVAFR